jgi:fumarate reductase flavoprotein subunit
MTHLEADVVIVAGGMSGICAAVAAAEKGASVIVFEKSETVGGAANMGMGFFAVESHIQKAQLIGLTVDEAFMKFMNFNHWKADGALVHKLFAQSASTVKWIEDMGVEFLGAFKYFNDSEATWHIPKFPGATKPVERCATVMIKAIYDRALELGVQFYMSTPVKKLQYNGKRVHGVVAVNSAGEEIEAECDAVIVCTGGFGNSPDLIRKYMGYEHGKDLYSFRIPGLNGDGLHMAWEIGAGFTEPMMEMTYETPGHTGGHAVDTVMRQPNLLINIDGKRFINEEVMAVTPFTGNAIARQRQRLGISIITDDIVEYYRTHGIDFNSYHKHLERIEEWDAAVSDLERGEGIDMRAVMGISGDEEFFVVADSIEELADRLGIAQETLKATIEEYNQFCATGRDTQFGKASRYLLPLTGKRFYACKFYPSGYGSLGGLKTDDSLRVVRPDGTAIDGLFSAGTDCCSIFGDTYMFYFPGSTMGFAINSGRMAGMNAVDFIDSYDFEEPLE